MAGRPFRDLEPGEAPPPDRYQIFAVNAPHPQHLTAHLDEVPTLPTQFKRENPAVITSYRPRGWAPTASVAETSRSRRRVRKERPGQGSIAGLAPSAFRRQLFGEARRQPKIGLLLAAGLFARALARPTGRRAAQAVLFARALRSARRAVQTRRPVGSKARTAPRSAAKAAKAAAKTTAGAAAKAAAGAIAKAAAGPAPSAAAETTAKAAAASAASAAQAAAA